MPPPFHLLRMKYLAFKRVEFWLNWGIKIFYICMAVSYWYLFLSKLYLGKLVLRSEKQRSGMSLIWKLVPELLTKGE